MSYESFPEMLLKALVFGVIANAVPISYFALKANAETLEREHKSGTLKSGEWFSRYYAAQARFVNWHWAVLLLVPIPLGYVFL